MLLVCLSLSSALVAPPMGSRRPCFAESKGFGGPPPAAPEKKPKSPLLQQLIEQEKERKAELDAQVSDLEERDAFVRSNADAGRVPDEVANRMVVRMATLGGVPTFGGIGLFVFYYFAAKGDNVFEPGVVAVSTTAPWILGLLGIGYGALSASWDEGEKGSLLGFKEFKLNIGRIVDGLRRSEKDDRLREEVIKRRKRRRG